MVELQVRLPYDAWGPADEWHEGCELLMFEFADELAENGVGVADDPDNVDEFICYFLVGDELPALKVAALAV